MPTTPVTTQMRWNVDGEKSKEVEEGQIIEDLSYWLLSMEHIRPVVEDQIPKCKTIEMKMY